jgi:hypothetical protein
MAAPASAQQTLDVSFVEQAPTIDGNIGESEWSDVAIVDQYFVQNEPEYGEKSPFRTVVRIPQSETALYVAFEAFDPDPSRVAADCLPTRHVRAVSGIAAGRHLLQQAGLGVLNRRY